MGPGGLAVHRDFEDMAAFLAQQMNQTAMSRLMRIAWRTVGKILERVVADRLDHDRLDGFVYIGVDEVSHGADRQFWTCVADHLKPRIVWAAPGRNAQTLQDFFAQLTDEQKRSIQAVSIDMSAGYEKAIRAKESLPHAQVCFDPFHVVKLGGEATDKVRRDEYNPARCCNRPHPGVRGLRSARPLWLSRLLRPRYAYATNTIAGTYFRMCGRRVDEDALVGVQRGTTGVLGGA